MIDCTIALAAYNRRETLAGPLARPAALPSGADRRRLPVAPRVEAVLDTVVELPA